MASRQAACIQDLPRCDTNWAWLICSMPRHLRSPFSLGSWSSSIDRNCDIAAGHVWRYLVWDIKIDELYGWGQTEFTQGITLIIQHGSWLTGRTYALLASSSPSGLSLQAFDLKIDRTDAFSCYSAWRTRCFVLEETPRLQEKSTSHDAMVINIERFRAILLQRFWHSCLVCSNWIIT